MESVAITLLAITYAAEVFGSLTYIAMFGQFWVLPFLVWLEVAYTADSDKWLVYAIMILLLSYPNRRLLTPTLVDAAYPAVAEAIHAAWTSRNSNAVRLQTVSTATYNIFQQLGEIIGSNIYQAGKPSRRLLNLLLLFARAAITHCIQTMHRCIAAVTRFCWACLP